MRPALSTSIRSALGTRGSPGIVRMSPVIGTRKPAPAEIRTSPTVTVKTQRSHSDDPTLLGDRKSVV